MYAQFAAESGCFDEAVDLARRSAERASEIGWAWWVVATLAQVALARGDYERAGVLWGSSETEQTMSGTRFDLGESGGRLPMETHPAFISARQHGQVLDLWDAVGIALGELHTPQTEP